MAFVGTRTACLIFAAAAGLVASCERASPLPNLVLITLDTTRADHLSTYGYGRVTDPFLAELARSSRVFEVAVPSATWTLPSHVSMFSGLDPEEHGCWMKPEEAGEEGMRKVSPETPLFTGSLRAAGYHQLAAVGGPFTSHAYGLLRDFDDWTEPGERWELPGEELNRWVFTALAERPKDRPLFLFVNYFDAHAPYGAPADRDYPFPEEPRELSVVPPLELREPGAPLHSPEVLRDAIDQYDRELLVQDEALAALFRRLKEEGLLENALVLVTSDHGEMFGEQRGTYGHGCLPFEPVARVPLLVRRMPAGPTDRIAHPVSLVNIPTTLLNAAGLARHQTGDGPPRFDLLALPDELPVPFVEHRGATRWLGALRGERFKYGCRLMSPERGLAAEGEAFLVDLEHDPGETMKPVTGDAADAAAKDLRGRLAQLLEAWRQPPAEFGRAQLDPAELERLRSLGY